MKKIKKLTCILLAVSLLIPQLPVKHVNAETAAEVVYAYERFNPKVEGEDVYVLEKNATANSEQWPAAWDNDGPAEWAFDGNDSHWYHSRYDNWGQRGIHDSNDVVTQTIKDTMYQNGNTLWIGSGFDESILLGKVTYQARNDYQGVIGRYKLYIANLANPTDTPTSDQYEEVASGLFQRTGSAQEIVLDTPVRATHFKLESISFGGGDGQDPNVIAAKNIAVYEAVEVLNQKAVLYVEAEEKWNDIKNNMNNSDATYKAQYDVAMVEENFKAVEAKINDDSVSDEEYAELLKNVFVFSDATGIGRYLSDIEWTASSNGYFPNERDGHCDSNNKISLKDTEGNRYYFDKGLSMHAQANATYNVTEYVKFKSYVGIDGVQNADAPSNVVFKILGDNDSELHVTSAITVATGMTNIEVDLNGVSNMKVIADTNGVDHNDHASWGDAKLYTALAVVPEISVELPTSGETPTTLENTDKYTVETVWTADGEEVTEFESGKVYNMTATFTAEEGYCFTDAAMADYTMTVVSEGNEKNVTPTVSIAADRKTMTVTYNSMKEVQVAYYTFDNVKGTTVYDEWGANRNGTAAEGVEYVAGKYGNAAKLSETNNIVFQEDTTLVDTWTVGYWVKLDETPTGRSSIMMSEDRNSSFNAKMESSDNMGVNVLVNGGTGILTYRSTTPTEGGKWVHHTWTNSKADGLKLYVNGVLIETNEWTKNNDYKAPIDVIGGTGFDGYVDDVKIYSVALTTEQVKASMLTPTDVHVFQGGSLRMDQEATVETNLRFGYDINDFNGGIVDEWTWNWGTSPNALTREVDGVKFIDGDGKITTNLVVTGIPASAYDTPVYAQLTVTYILSDGQKVVLKSDIQSRSVCEVARNAMEKHELDMDAYLETKEGKYMQAILDTCPEH